MPVAQPWRLVAQTFTVGSTGRLSGIELSLSRGTFPEAGDLLRLTVFDMSGTMLGSATIEARSIASAGGPSDLRATMIGPGFFDLCAAAIDVTSLVDPALSPDVGHRQKGRIPFQTVRADFPHTAYRWSLETRHYAASG